MSTSVVESKKASSFTQLVFQGAIAGLAGGVVFGIMMGMMGMLPMIGMLVRQDSAAVGFIVHMAISAFIGIVYRVAIDRIANTLPLALIGGVVNGVVWWILGALLLMPLMLGMSEMVLVVGQDQWLSLLGHIIFGMVAALVVFALRRNN
jgi:uncharacterized membrane protein YagU involved in acid resistance